jgi:ribulose-phosphate 3-epimerase
MPSAYERIAELATCVEIPIQVDGGIDETNAADVRAAGARLLVAGSAVFDDPDPAAAYGRIAAAAG